ncbi:hypothetical protein SLEP1_g17522 [Rubroshorea leprosula]|uniref:Integrase catalytic domain-containing protein n=1 Tax=Rubroshorea leprosula TaxID=152421 RepID=A0AAV5J3M4_9ROSI|nr:hypothetical protein SLEP1_g17522 [Rubroshorea leprosula]
MSSNNHGSSLSYPPLFIGKNYNVWAIKMKTFLREGDERVKGQNMVTLKREFAMLKMKDTETVHQYFSKVMDMVNKIRLNAVLRAEDTAEGAFQAKEKQHAAGYGRRQLPSRAERGKAVDVPSQESLKYSAGFARSMVTLRDTAKPKLARVDMVDNCFPLLWKSPIQSVHVSKVDNTDLRHMTYGHFNVKSLKFMQYNELVRDVSEIYLNGDVCGSCQYGKLHRQSFPVNQSWRAKQKLELVHTDKKFKALFEKQSGCQINTLRLDNGKEYTSSEFDKFCEDAGIAHQLTVPCTPQQNGVAERKKRTIMEMASPKAIEFITWQLGKLPFTDVQFDENAYWDWNKKEAVKAILANDDAEASKKADQNLFDDSEVDGIDAYQDTPEEIDMINKNGTWELTSKPEEKHVIGVKRVYRTKMSPDGSIHKHKARLVVKGYAQRPRVDYGDTFAPVARHDTIRLLLALSACMGWKLYLMDVKSAFLKGYLQEDIFVEQPEGFVISGQECSKALFKVKMNQLWSDLQMPHQFKTAMNTEFEMSNLGEMSYFLGVEITQLVDGIYVSQHKYSLNVLKKFNMEVANLWKHHCQVHYGAAKRVIRYLKGTFDYGLMFKKSKACVLELEGYADSDWAGCFEDAKSTTGLVFNLGSAAFSWISRKQDAVAQSTAEAKYIAAAEAASHSAWICKVLTDVRCQQIQPCVLHCDNNKAFAIAHNPVQHGRTKHINVKCHVLRNMVQNNELKLIFCSTEEQVADTLIKALPRAKFEMQGVIEE